jgi:hypothetical protein
MTDGHLSWQAILFKWWSDDMHAMLAYLNAAGRHKVRSTPRSNSFWNLLHSLLASRGSKGGAKPAGPDPKAARERASETVSRPGGYRNDPDDPTNPNEAIERSRQTLRPNPLKRAPK